MIEVILPGQLPEEKVKVIRVFRCDYCGCVVKADQDDYFHDWMHYSYHAFCPTCNRIINEDICPPSVDS